MSSATTAAGRNGSGRRTTIAVAAAVATLVAVTFVILLVGWVPVPELPALADDPDPSLAGTIVHATASEEGTCLVVAEASGSGSRELPCLDVFADGVSWTTDGRIVVRSYGELGPQLDVVEPASGGILETILLDPTAPLPESRLGGEAIRPDGVRVVAGGGAPLPSGTARLVRFAPDGTRTVIAELEGPRDYSFTGVTWSPDGSWVLASDSRGRLIIVAEDGDPGPRLLADTGDDDRWEVPAAWHIPGNPTGAIDLDQVRSGQRRGG